MKQKLEQIGVVLVESSENKDNNYEKILENCKYDKVCSLQVKDKRIFPKIANRGYIAMGECYVNGDFNCTPDDITELITRCLSNNYYEYYFNFWNRLLHKLEFETVNLQTTSRAWEVGRKHYDLGKSSYTTTIYCCWCDSEKMSNEIFRKFVVQCSLRQKHDVFVWLLGKCR